MVIIAHADDAEFGAAGTIAKWVREGKEVTYVVATNGNKGSADPSMTTERLAEIREAEQRAAAKVLGVKRVIFLGYPDGELEHTLKLRKDLTRQIRKYKPDIVLTPDPTTWYYGDRYVNHPDHRAIGAAALAAIFPSARDRLTFAELLADGLEPHKVSELYMTIATQPDVWVDIDETMETKIEALREHRSQMGCMDAVEKRVRERAETMAAGRGMKYAEAFKRMMLPD